MKKSLQDSFEGAFLGAACGDAFGALTRNLSTSVIKVRFRGGLKEFPVGKTHLFTDDTQLTLCVAESLINKKAFDARDLASRFVSWANSVENFRDPSRTFIRAARNLRDVSNLENSGLPSTCGAAAARVMPFGLFYRNLPEDCISAAAHTARLTHSDPCARAAAAAVALTVAKLSNDCKPGDIIPEVLSDVTSLSEGFAQCLEMVGKCLSFDEEAAFNFLGRGSNLHDIVGCAFYCFLNNTDSYEKTVLTAVNGGGQADSIACLAGAFSGAYLGVQAIPKSWLDTIEDNGGIRKTAQKLLKASLERD